MTEEEQRGRELLCAVAGHVWRRRIMDPPAPRCLYCGKLRIPPTQTTARPS